MSARDFIIADTEKLINRSALAKLMYGDKKSSVFKLAHKLSGERGWTDADEKKARDVLKELRIRIEGLEKG